MSLLTADYDYPLPESLIARYPTERREGARMMVLHRATQTIEHRHFADFPTFLTPQDLVVLNDTRVIPARTFSDDGKVEFLFLEQLAPPPGEGASLSATQSVTPPSGPATWRCLVKPGRKMRVGAEVHVGGVRGIVQAIEPEGERVITFDAPIDLDRHGELPLPPYFERRSENSDRDRYQTVFAREPGAVAAPTAGLHFTPEILARIRHTFLTLHVGVGTFRPVQVDDLSQHRMHRERYAVSESTAAAVNAVHPPGRVVAIGTTTARVLESLGRPLPAGSGSTEIFIHPPYTPRAVDVLLTNFHLPKSTLLMLVSAFAGREFTLRAYAEAVAQKYRFYSYGDCMLLV